MKGLLLAGVLPAFAPQTIDPTQMPLQCGFEAPDQPSIQVILEPRPMMLTKKGRHSLRLTLDRRLSMPAKAWRLERTEARDVVVQGRGPDKQTYVLVIRDDGRAMFTTLADLRKEDAPGKQGTCVNFRETLEHWLMS